MIASTMPFILLWAGVEIFRKAINDLVLQYLSSEKGYRLAQVRVGGSRRFLKIDPENLHTCSRNPYRPVNGRCVFPVGACFGFWIWILGALRNPKIQNKNNTDRSSRPRKRLEEHVNIWAFVRKICVTSQLHGNYLFNCFSTG